MNAPILPSIANHAVSVFLSFTRPLKATRFSPNATVRRVPSMGTLGTL